MEFILYWSITITNKITHLYNYNNKHTIYSYLNMSNYTISNT